MRSDYNSTCILTVLWRYYGIREGQENGFSILLQGRGQRVQFDFENVPAPALVSCFC